MRRIAILFVLVASCSSRSHRDDPGPVPVPVPSPVPLPAPAKKKLILHPHPGQDPTATPQFIKGNLAFLQSQPFDGMSVYMRDGGMNVTATINTDAPVTVERIRAILEPVKGGKNLFAFVLGSAPPDFFHDWTVVVENWRNLSTVCREMGLAGILFDNEQYAKAWGNWLEGTGRTLEEAQAQAVVRGRQVMSAVVAEYPSIAVITLHGPSVSRFDAPSPLFPQWQSANELLGPFFSGFLAGSGGTAEIVDGGEIYHLRTFQQFDESYKWRKKQWPDASISFGVYDVPFDAPMDPAILRTTLANAFKKADKWVWMYPELSTFLLPPPAGASIPWVDAIRMARKDAGN